MSRCGVGLIISLLFTGTRSDLIEVKEAIDQGHELNHIVEQYFEVFVKYPNGITTAYGILREKRLKASWRLRMETQTLRTWQEEVISALERQDQRQILWITDIVGNQGKSFMASYLFACKGGFLYYPGKECDNAYRYNHETLVVVDISRASVDDVLYGDLEHYKNGRVNSTKYTPQLKLSMDVKIVVFANELPNFNRWSIDRYDCYDLSDGELTYVTPI